MATRIGNMVDIDQRWKEMVDFAIDYTNSTKLPSRGAVEAETIAGMLAAKHCATHGHSLTTGGWARGWNTPSSWFRCKCCGLACSEPFGRFDYLPEEW